MSNIITMNNSMFGDVRFLNIEGKPYAVASDVAKALGYKRPNDAINQHCKGVTKRRVSHPQNEDKMLEVNIIPESDILLLIQKCRTKPEEYKTNFKNWLVSESLIDDLFVVETMHETEFLYKLEKRIKLYNEIYRKVFKMSCSENSASDEYINSTNYIYDIHLERQKEVCERKYKIDCYIEKFHLAIEYDEEQHRFNAEEDLQREHEINKWFLENSTEEIGDITFIRVEKGREEYYLELIMGYLTIEV